MIAEIGILGGFKGGLLYRIFYRAGIQKEVGSLYAGNVPEIKLCREESV